MLDNKKAIKPDQIIELVIKYRWFIIVPFCLAMITGICLAFAIPETYRAGTTILVQAQKVPSTFVQSLVSLAIDDRINTIKQQIMSRTNLEKIMKDFKLLTEPKYAKMYAEDKIDTLRKRITVDVVRARGGTDAFSISFEGKKPDTVMQVTNSLASFFINENLKVREAQAIGTSDFLDDQLNSMRKKLVGLEEALKQYRIKNMGSLPEQLDSNLRVLDRLQVQLDTRQQNLRDAKNMLLTLEKQISEGRNATVDLSTLRRNRQAGSSSENASELQQLKDQLADLQSRYTDKHPDVVRLKQSIAKLEGTAEKQADQASPETPEATQQQPEPDYKALQQIQRNEIKREIESHQSEISKIRKQIDAYQKRVEDTPKREQELLSLKRDYSNIQEAYNSLLARKLEAEMSVSMEKKQKGEQFWVLDPAKLPQKPISPNMNKLFALSLAAGLGIGAGFIFLFFYLDSSFRRPEEIESALGLSVLATLPTLYQSKDIKKQRFNLILSLIGIMVALFLLAVFAVLTIKGVDQSLAFIKGLINM